MFEEGLESWMREAATAAVYHLVQVQSPGLPAAQALVASRCISQHPPSAHLLQQRLRLCQSVVAAGQLVCHRRHLGQGGRLMQR